MPLVTITTSGALTTPDDRPVKWVKMLGEELPRSLFIHREDLKLESNMPIEGTQVVFRTFGPDDINRPDLWILIQFSESIPKVHMRKASHVIESIIDGYFKELHAAQPNIAVDLMWAPSHGYVRFGNETHRW